MHVLYYINTFTAKSYFPIYLIPKRFVSASEGLSWATSIRAVRSYVRACAGGYELCTGL